MILFRECLRHNIVPFIIEDANRLQYPDALKAYRQDKSTTDLTDLFKKEQKFYLDQCKYFLTHKEYKNFN